MLWKNSYEEVQYQAVKLIVIKFNHKLLQRIAIFAIKEFPRIPIK